MVDVVVRPVIRDTVTVRPRNPTMSGVQVVVAGPQGPKGVQGDTGPQGEQGPTGGAVTHTQSSPSASWIINHGLGRYPVVEVIVGGELVMADISFIDVNNIAVVFAQATTGYAILG